MTVASRSRWLGFGLALLAGMFAAAGSAVSGLAVGPSACVVNTATDEHAVSATTSCDSTAGTGMVTLRSAIEALNSSGGGAITFTLPNPTTITETNGQLDITATGAMTITGPGARALAIDGNADDRVIDMQGNTNVTLTGVTVQNGNTNGDGGGIQTFGTLVLDAVTVKNNVASYAGGIDVRQTEAPPPNLTMVNSTVTGNHGAAAGISIEGVETSHLTNDTISGNVNDASADEATGLEVYGTGAVADLNFVTLAGNQFTASGTPGSLPAAGLGVYNGGLANVHNSLLSANQPQNCAVETDNGTITDQGYNLDSGSTCGFSTGSHDFVSGNPMLQALANNGGQTDTMALGSGSQALDSADPSCPPPAADQRGTTRPQGSACDMGAFELPVVVASAAPAATIPALPKSGSDGTPVARGGTDYTGMTLLAIGLILAIAALIRVRRIS
jgi:hypothetical protein